MMLKQHFSKIYDPIFQALLAFAGAVLLSLVDMMLPHEEIIFDPASGPWIVTTAMIFSFIILNTIVAIRTEPIIPYWRKSIFCYVGLLAISYLWCWMLSGKHIDDVGTFRWIWIVLTLVYLVFFAIARSMKKIVDFAIRQDEKLRGE